MAGTTIRSAVPQTKVFPAPWNDITATIRPAGIVEERARQELVKKRSEAYEADGSIRIDTDVNVVDLWVEEIWLTYEDITVTDEKGKPVFKPRKETNRQEFMNTLDALNPETDFLRAWTALVREVNPTWRRPFL